MTAVRSYIGAVALAAIAGQAHAVSLETCTRTTHVSHGGEALHRDLGQGRVAWLDWWSQEGTAHWIIIAECESGDALKLLTAEENMNARAPFNKTEKAEQIITREHRAARVFATLPRIAAAMKGTARDIETTILTEEPCACAALYAELRGEKEPFELKDLMP